LAGPMLLGLLGLVAGLFTAWLNTYLLSPAGTAVSGEAVDAHLRLAFDLASPAVWASIVTWVFGGLLFWKADALRSALRRAGETIGWTFDAGFDAAMFGLIGLSDALTRTFHHGRMEWYMLTFFALAIAALYLPLAIMGGLPSMPALPSLPFYEWGVLLLTAAGLLAVVLFRVRLNAIVALGIQGFGTAVIFM